MEAHSNTDISVSLKGQAQILSNASVVAVRPKSSWFAALVPIERCCYVWKSCIFQKLESKKFPRQLPVRFGSSVERFTADSSYHTPHALVLVIISFVFRSLNERMSRNTNTRGMQGAIADVIYAYAILMLETSSHPDVWGCSAFQRTAVVIHRDHKSVLGLVATTTL